MKQMVRKEYFETSTSSVLTSSLNGDKVISTLNTWVVATARYGAGIINCNKDELNRFDWQTRKLITMHGGLHHHTNVDRLYIPRTGGGRGLKRLCWAGKTKPITSCYEQ